MTDSGISLHVDDRLCDQTFEGSTSSSSLMSSITIHRIEDVFDLLRKPRKDLIPDSIPKGFTHPIDSQTPTQLLGEIPPNDCPTSSSNPASRIEEASALKSICEGGEAELVSMRDQSLTTETRDSAIPKDTLSVGENELGEPP